MEFGHNFLWGAATSAHQVEGDNSANDWWEFESAFKLKYPSLKACRHYEFYQEDFDLASQLNHNCHRFSIEWSRIEPVPGEFRQSEIEHYRRVLSALKERRLEPVVTLHHFTNPVWFSRLGGWANRKSRFYFLRFTEKVVSEFAKDVKFWITINEPTVYAYHAFLLGAWPPQEKSILKSKAVLDNFADAHIKAYRLIRDIYKKQNLLMPKISISANLQAFEYCQPTLINKLAVYLRNKFYNFSFIDKLIRHKSLDYIGLNYYGRSLVEVNNLGLANIFMDTCQKNHLPLKKNSLGWDIYPLGLYKLLILLKKYKLPVLITENGICTEDDDLRWEYISGHLESIKMALSEGVDILGYIYWSLLDNFEWDKGFVPRFGLIHVDYDNYKRTVRESAKKMSAICNASQQTDDR